MPENSTSDPTSDLIDDTVSRTHALVQPPGGGEIVSQPAAPPGYELREEIGRGGMGAVFRARDLALDREVAVKLLLDIYGPDSGAARRFLEEAQITGQLQHPGIPAVHQTGTTPDGRPFLAMKLVKGRTLAELLKDRADPAVDRGRFLAIFEHVCHAVGYAHAHHVIHRDLKPSNIMVGAFDEVQVMDWGLAKVLTAGGSREAADPLPDSEAELTRTAIGTRRGADMATQTGSVLGTPAFMSPEQAAGEAEKMDARADVFGLGAILCVMLTGQPPYRGGSVDAVRLQAIRGELNEAFARLDSSGAEVELIALAKRCLSALADRPADAVEVASAVAGLRAASEERAQRAERERAAAEVRVAEQRKRRKVWYALAGALVLGAAASVVFAIRARQAEGRAIEQRDLTEKAREEAVANAEKASAADAARRLELGKTAAAAAQLAAGRGRWRDAMRLYGTALELGGGDEIELKLGHYDCRMALGQMGEGVKELAALAARSDSGPHAGTILLRRADSAMWRKDGGDPRDLARQAIAKGLSPGDEAYAKVYLADTAPEAIAHLQESLRRDPFQHRGLDSLMTLLTITGRRDELREVVTRMRLVEAGSVNQLTGDLFLAALDGDAAGVERALTRLSSSGYAEMMPLMRALGELMVAAQHEEFFFGAADQQKLTSMLTEYGKLAPALSKMAGDSNADGTRIRDMSFLRLPMFQAMAEMPHIKSLSASNPLAAFALLNEPAKLAELLGDVSRSIPDGMFLMLRGIFLQRAGKLAEAEAALSRALESPSWANHRTACRFHLMVIRFALATDARTPPAERAAGLARALTGARELAGKLPPEPALMVVAVANAGGDHALGLTEAEAILREQPDSPSALRWRLTQATKLGALDRAAKAADALFALAAGKDDVPLFTWQAIHLLAEALRGTGRLGDALTWLDRLRVRATAMAAAAPADEQIWTLLDNLGVSYWQMGKYDRAIPIYERNWNVRRKAKGEAHSDTLRSRVNLAINLRDAGRAADAIAHLEPAARDGRLLPSVGPWAPTELLRAYIAAGETAKGEALAKEILTAARKRHPADSQPLAQELATIGFELLRLKAWADAESVLRECLTLREKLAKTPVANASGSPLVMPWQVANAKSMLGAALLGQKKYADAEPLLRAGYEGLKKDAATMPQNKHNLRKAIEQLIELCDATGRKDEAGKWRTELAAVPEKP